MDIKTRLETEPLVIEMPAGERGRLFGSVTSTNIADALQAQGIPVERRRIDIPEKTIKSVGTTYVRVRLYGEQEAELRVDVKAVGATAADEAASAAAATAESADNASAPTEAAAEAVAGTEGVQAPVEPEEAAETASANDGVDTSDEEE